MENFVSKMKMLLGRELSELERVVLKKIYNSMLATIDMRVPGFFDICGHNCECFNRIQKGGDIRIFLKPMYNKTYKKYSFAIDTVKKDIIARHNCFIIIPYRFDMKTGDLTYDRKREWLVNDRF